MALLQGLSSADALGDGRRPSLGSAEGTPLDCCQARVRLAPHAHVAFCCRICGGLSQLQQEMKRWSLVVLSAGGSQPGTSS